MVDWQRFCPVLCHRRPEAVPFETTGQSDAAVVSAIDASARMKPGFTPDYQRIPKEMSFLVSEKHYLQRRWQATRDPVDKFAFNQMAGVLRRDLQTFRRKWWGLAVDKSSEVDAEAAHIEYTPD